MQAAIAARDLEIGFGQVTLLGPLAFHVERGQSIAITGPNGSGKTTLIRTLAGLMKPRVGRIERRVTRIGYVPQAMVPDSFVPMTCIEALRIQFAPGALFLSAAERRKREDTINGLMEDLQILPLRDQQLSKISVGELQRTLIARALVNDPDVLLLDEPTSALDSRAIESVRSILAARLEQGCVLISSMHRTTQDYGIPIDREWQIESGALAEVKA